VALVDDLTEGTSPRETAFLPPLIAGLFSVALVRTIPSDLVSTLALVATLLRLRFILGRRVPDTRVTNADNMDQRTSVKRGRQMGHVWTLLGATSLVVSAGCGTLTGGKICTDTDLTTPPIHFFGSREPLTFTATLTSDGTPVAGADVIFFVYRLAASQAASSEVGFNIGSGTTDAGGLARYTQKGGIEGLVHSNDRLTGYEAQYRPVAKVGGIQYCGARSRGELTVG
jgi:hypothetical protein